MQGYIILTVSTIWTQYTALDKQGLYWPQTKFNLA